MSRGTAVAGATVEVYLSAGRGRESTPFAAAATGADGSFRLELPAGSYWVWVKDLASTQGPRRLAEYPGNPVQLAAGATQSLGEVELHAVGTSQEVGRRSRRRRPRARPARRRTRRGDGRHDLRRQASTAAGRARIHRAGAHRTPMAAFRSISPPGAYRFAARRRRSGATSGYLQAGDLSATAPQDPI